ncbi:MAG: class I SAM-dependent methyltransferase [Candidatus Woesearchaeota archaeon]
MTEHYYSKNPTSEVREERIHFQVRGSTFTAIGASGLFSKEKLDKATHLLIQHCQVDNCKRVLDLGCGWGPIVLCLATTPQNFSLAKDCELFAVDSNSRAVNYTKKNLRLNINNQPKNYILSTLVKVSDGFENIQDQKFDAILTNPPYAAGRKVCFSFIEESKNHLLPGGSLQLVARHNKGGKTLSAHMESIFGNVKTLVKKGGFRVYKSVF